MRRVGLTVALIALGAAPVRAEALKARFIGNEAFEITDGKVTLLSDFPYHSGAYGYMKYRFEDVRPQGKVLCLITHKHEDHFDPTLFKKTDWTLLGPAKMVRGVDPAKLLPIQDLVRFEDMEIRPIRTPHGNMEHYSYWVRWHGLKLFFSGDTEEMDALTRIGKADVVFISPWLLESWQGLGPPNAGRVIVYHHKADEKIQCIQCVVPKQGDEIEISY
ncbi:MAG: MBL fold metallo-hydrolase [Acidobacteria bacterium]|nr:MBL fold metallo-hydrolase [Acidobacteriota bacterium]